MSASILQLKIYEEILESAKQKTPFATGKLQESILHHIHSSPHIHDGEVIVVPKNHHYNYMHNIKITISTPHGKSNLIKALFFHMHPAIGKWQTIAENFAKSEKVVWI